MSKGKVNRITSICKHIASLQRACYDSEGDLVRSGKHEIVRRDWSNPQNIRLKFEDGEVYKITVEKVK